MFEAPAGLEAHSGGSGGQWEDRDIEYIRHVFQTRLLTRHPRIAIAMAEELQRRRRLIFRLGSDHANLRISAARPGRRMSRRFKTLG